tara:strand:+ start:782 stop:1012 length:231 start_codon:yes stop_codon:yes gene_type:complete
MATIGNQRRKSKNSVEKSPKLPISIMMSTFVGEKYAQLDGRKSRLKEVIVITKRSNHIPMFTKIETIHIAIGVVRM